MSTTTGTDLEARVATAAAAFYALQDELTEKIGLRPNVAHYSDGEWVVVRASTTKYTYRGLRRDGAGEHLVNGGRVEDHHRVARRYAALVDHHAERLDQLLVLWREHQDAVTAFNNAASWAIDVDGHIVEHHYTERGATIALSRHPGGRIVPPAVTGGSH